METFCATSAFFSFFTGPVTRIGAILCAFAQDLAMLVTGRVCLGAGVGFTNQVRFSFSFLLSTCGFQQLSAHIFSVKPTHQSQIVDNSVVHGHTDIRLLTIVLCEYRI